MPSSEAAQWLPRGVRRAPYLGLHGGIVLVAIDSRGRNVETREVPAGGDVLAAWDELEDWLEFIDPPELRPQLRLVKPAPKPRPFSGAIHARIFRARRLAGP